MVAGPFQEFVSGPVLFSPIVFCCCALSTDTGRKKNKGAQSVFDELGMEWREQSTVSCETAFLEAQRWVEEVTKKRFGSGNFRSALEDGVLLCDLINKLKPGIVKKVNRLSTPIAGLDNVNVFLKACGKLGLREAQLFHPGDLQDLSSRVTVKPEETSRRLKNVLITIYWLGRKAQVDPIYNGPYLNLKAFEGLLGLALSKALEESAAPKAYVRDSGFGDSWYVEKEEQFSVQPSHRRDDSLDSLDSVGSQTLSISSDATLKGSSEGCGSDAEAELGFRMTESKDALHYRRSMVAEPKVATQFNQFLPTRDKAQSGYVPAPLRKKRAERNEVNRLSWASPMYTEDDGTFTSGGGTGSDPSLQNGHRPRSAPQWPYEYESGSDSDLDRPDPDLVLDDLASRRFHSPSPTTPANFALPMSPLEAGSRPRASWLLSAVSSVPQHSLARLSGTSAPPPPARARPGAEPYDSEEDEDDEAGYADPVQDDLYSRKVGLSAPPPAREPYDRFLPKFWTPEEDAHVRTIKLGSQRRPWYRKLQGFSQKKSGSSSEGSDSDAGAGLVPPQSDTPPSHGSAHPQPPAAQSARTQPRTVSLPLTALPHPILPRPPDPSAGPRLVRCERPLFPRPLSPRHALPDLENDDMFTRRTHASHSCPDLADLTSLGPRHACEEGFVIVTQPRRGKPVFPDVERDDLLYRKVNPRLAERRPLSGGPDAYNAVPVPEPWALPAKLHARLLCPPCPPAEEEEEEEEEAGGDGGVRSECSAKDDMLLRKLGAGLPKQMGPSPSLALPPAVPASCSEEDLLKWRTIREAGRLRHKKRLMVERLLQKRSGHDGSKSMSDIAVDPGVLRQVRYDELQKIRAQAKDSEDQWQNDLTKWKNRRRSVNSDIVKKKEEREQIEHITSSTGSSRRSKTFKEMQEEREGRGHATPTQNIGVGQDVFPEPVPQPRSRTLPPRSYTVDSLYVSPAVAPAQRDRSPAPTPEPKLDSTPAVKPRSASPAKTSANRASPTSANQADLTSVSQTSPTGTKDAELTGTTLKDQTSTLPSNRTSPAPAPTPADPSSDPPSTLVNIGPAATSKTEESSAGTVSRAPEFKRPFTRAVEEQSSGSLYKHNSMDTKPAAARVSASLPRSYQRLDSARLTSVVTARPFGTQSTRIASLPRTFAIEDSHKRLNGETGPRKPAVPSLYSQFMTEDEARTQASQAQSSNEDEDEEEEEEEEQQETVAPAAPLSSGDGTRPDPVSTLDLAPKLDDAQELFCDMRISLNQKPNSSRDFGFQANWDSTGAFIKSVQEGSPAELCQLRAGDEVLAVSGHKVSEMSYEQWKGSLDAALQKGCLVMDVRRHGNNGAPEKYINICREFAPRPSSETAEKATDTSGQPVNDLTSKGVNGGFRDESVTMRNKESEPISLKNLKRRSEFFEQQGGSESPLSDLQVPSIGTSSNRWSWDPEDERRRQEKWQRDQERLLQEKYKRDQEKMDEEWRRAQQEAQEEESRVREMVQKATETDSRSLSPYSPVSPLNQAPSPPWAEPACRDEEKEEEEEERREAELEEMRRRERQEQLQREEEEEEKERQRRAEEARLQRKREAELEEMKRREEEEEERQRRAEEMRLQRKREAELQEQRRLDEEEMKRREEEMKRREEEMKRHQEAADEQRRFEEEQQERIQEQWAGESYGFAKILPEISASDRAKSKSTPELDEADKDQGRVVNSGGASDSSWRKPGQPGQPPLSSQAESERQQILEEMKKKTHLLTDSSWIRQRSASVNKEPANPPAGGGVRRGESLDNLDADRSWTTPSWSSGNPSYSRPHSAASAHGYTRPASCTLPTSYSTGSLRQQSAWAPPAPVSPTSPTAVNEDPSPEPSQQRGRSVSGKKICTFCDSPLGKGAAMIIESLGLCYHLGCFKCIDCKSDLGGSESGAEVRIRNRQLYCNACYVRFKTGQPTSM
ncbi:hypothetical protein AAFF_G00334820 [Aldrovandia affinis]|uniref:LIM domain only protein 7 n=1 Tax=Aldrovandia affinis TaxID=143900 RepID=A0AAD7SL35_9TELE|nr:hypothetical protein AAFF_G00334820 [Aldrovandia affinis]